MLGFLFRGLTANPARGARLFDAVTAEARRPHWYVEGNVSDTLVGRFAVLSTIAALVMVRLEAEGEEGDLASVGLTERFIAVMESEHRELGLGDPTLGKTVRKLVGILAQRTAGWREACGGAKPWEEAVRESLYKDDAPPDALRHSAEALRQLWTSLGKISVAELEKGKIG
jgi:cytochrome b pre-mRNA-processing protein 3